MTEADPHGVGYVLHTAFLFFIVCRCSKRAASIIESCSPMEALHVVWWIMPSVLKGYDLGAEDYITKPFSMKVLLRKIERIFKRTQPEQPGGYDDGYLKIDWERAKVMVDQKACAITPTEFRLLKVLAENQGRLLTYEILLEQLWDCDGQFVDKHTLAVNVNRLRRKLENHEHKYISNVYGMGYQWIG